MSVLCDEERTSIVEYRYVIGLDIEKEVVITFQDGVFQSVHYPKGGSTGREQWIVYGDVADQIALLEQEFAHVDEFMLSSAKSLLNVGDLVEASADRVLMIGGKNVPCAVVWNLSPLVLGSLDGSVCSAGGKINETELNHIGEVALEVLERSAKCYEPFNVEDITHG